jgi:hypothetical protein
MSKGTLVALLVVLAYVGFEGYAIHKLGYRMEGPYIHDHFVSAYRALNACGTAEDGQREKFLRNLASIRERASRELAEKQPEASREEVDRMLSTRATIREQEVDALVNAGGCTDKEVWKLLKRFEIYAGWNLP